MDELWQRRRVEASEYFENLLAKLTELEKLFHVKQKAIPHLNDDMYFSDGIRKIDFIFVYRLSNRGHIKAIVNTYIRNLEGEGVQFETAASTISTDLLFIKVHISRNPLLMCSILLNYEPHFMRLPDAPLTETQIINLPFMSTDLTKPAMFSEVVQRASESALGARPKDFTNAERIMIGAALLENVQFGKHDYDKGMQYMLDRKYLEAVYPLHDMPIIWTQAGTLNDRQVLKRYWASMSQIVKYQPLDLIHKYFGPEIAFYFAFVGFYNRWLLPMGFLGALALFYGLVTCDSQRNIWRHSFCKSKDMLCPDCQKLQYCNFRSFQKECNLTLYHYILDNPAVTAYAIIVCFWSTFCSHPFYYYKDGQSK